MQIVLEITLRGPSVSDWIRRRPWRVYDWNFADCGLLLAPEPFQAGVVWPDERHWSPWRYDDGSVNALLRRELSVWWMPEVPYERPTT